MMTEFYPFKAAHLQISPDNTDINIDPGSVWCKLHMSISTSPLYVVQ